MRPDKTRLLGLAAALAVAVPAAACYAQPSAQAAPPAASGAQHRPMMDPAQRAAQRTEHLRTVLQLRAEQEPALKAYIAALQPPPGAMEARRKRRGEMAGMTTPQRIEAMRRGMDERRARFDAHAQATLKFYSQLSPAQQKAFDAMGPQRGPGGGPGMHGKGGRGGGFRG